jgi:type IV secretory pathway VirJ component
VKRILAVAGACLIGIALIWHAWSWVSMDKAAVALPARSTSAPAKPDDVLAIIFSGDGGWADLDRQIGEELVAHGIPVLGVNTFQYYWHARTVDESATQLDALISRNLVAYGKRRVWLIGFSFGADVLPSIVARLSPGNRDCIAQLVLLSPGRDLTFEIELEGYMSRQGWFQEHLKSVLQWFNPIAHYPGIPPLLALNGQPAVACYYGAEERDTSLCTAPGVPAWLQVHEKSGGHHFDGDYKSLARQLIENLPANG